jgi:hypothetical protein
MKQLYSTLRQSISRTTSTLLFLVAGIQFASIGQATKSLTNNEIISEFKDML